MATYSKTFARIGRQKRADYPRRKQAVLAIPSIDLGATFQVIDDSGEHPTWQVIGRGYATKQHAHALMKAHHLQGIWMVDDLGYKTYILASDQHA